MGFFAVAATLGLVIPAHLAGDAGKAATRTTDQAPGVARATPDGATRTEHANRPSDAAPMRNTQPADAPAYRPGAVQRVKLDMLEKTVEIAPGTVVKVWTFGPKVP